MYKLLLADDESDIRDGLMEVIHFEKYGFTVVGQAENGLEALRLCEEQEPDLIVSDIRMPLMDGLTMLAEAEKALPTPSSSAATTNLNSLVRPYRSIAWAICSSQFLPPSLPRH